MEAKSCNFFLSFRFFQNFRLILSFLQLMVNEKKNKFYLCAKIYMFIDVIDSYRLLLPAYALLLIFFFRRKNICFSCIYFFLMKMMSYSEKTGNVALNVLIYKSWNF
jgi:hypothetical protein